MDELEDLDIQLFVEENRRWIVSVLRNSTDEYTRACAYALLLKGSTEREIETILREVERLSQEPL